MRRTPLAIVVAFAALPGSLLAVSPASPITRSLTEAWTAQSAEVKRPSNEWIAWRLGREYGFASAWTIMKESAQSEKSLGFARTLARTLGISEPPPPAEYRQHVVALAKELGAKHGEQTRYHFLAGIRMVDTWFGTVIGSDVKTQVADLATFLERSGIPPSVWSTQLKAIQAKPSEADLTKLGETIDAHLKR